MLFAPDSELHGVLARQRELEELAGAIDAAKLAAGAARAALDTVELTLKERQQTYHEESAALASQQRRVHDLELELLQLKQAAEAAERRRAQIAQETAEIDAQHAAERDARAAQDATIADLQSRLHDVNAELEAARQRRSEADAALAQGHEGLRAAERAVQEAGFAERSARERQAELDRRAESLAAQVAQQHGLLAQLTSERQAIDWTPVEEALQRQLVTRGQAEAALAAARDAQEALGTTLREAEEARLVAEQKVDPARVKIQEMQLKEQAAALQEQQYAEQLAEVARRPGRAARGAEGVGRGAHAARGDRAAAPARSPSSAPSTSRRWTSSSRRPSARTTSTGSPPTSPRRWPRSRRRSARSTANRARCCSRRSTRVNENFAKLFPALFGGGQAQLVLTGDEILDAGVQVTAQPPGKRNTSIHLLSGGEKALTAISLVFALFQINPAPFCLLDEVDAPLDDPNTDRFCKMVQQMTVETQFLFISHNKITMEMAQQLVGITMPDPGVSRVVAVDIAEALELAESARPVAAAAAS